MAVVVRFAPSPTGYMHVGNVRTALFNWVFARQHDGSFILRFDDTDQERSQHEFITAISRDLNWIGVYPDRTEWQSKRIELYDDAFNRLASYGCVYACYETESELEDQRKYQLACGLPPVYNRACIRLSDEEHRVLLAKGKKPYWRFLLSREQVSWHDLVRGKQIVNLTSLSDPIIRRTDGTYLYSFASVVDDIDMGVTHVIRGEDHVTNTGPQIEMFKVLSDERHPVFAHHSLLFSEDGEILSKRLGGLSIGSLRLEGLEPEAVISSAVVSSLDQDSEPHLNTTGLMSVFDISTSGAVVKVSLSKIKELNARIVRQLDYSTVEARLIGLGVQGGRSFWEAVRGNCSTVAEALQWWKIIIGPVCCTNHFCEDDKKLLITAISCLPGEPWTNNVWDEWMSKLAEAKVYKTGKLLSMVRLILTGLKAGPELRGFLPLLGRQAIIDRMGACGVQVPDVFSPQ